MRHLRLTCALTFALLGAAAIAEGNGRPVTAPPAPPAVPVERPTVPPADPPGTLIEFVCSLLPVPYLCD